MEMTLCYVHGENIGYARAGSFLADNLRDRGVQVWDDDGFVAPEMAAQSQVQLRGRDTDGTMAPPSPTNLLCYVSVPTHVKGWWDQQYKSILTMWEAKHMPPAFRETFHEFDMILVPSQQNLELFSQYHNNVHYIPLGVDTARWHYVEPPPVGAEFRFMISGRGSRKGVDIAFEAFRRVFPRGNPPKPGMALPKLIMKSRRGLGEYYAPGVDQVTGNLTPEEESDLYESIHCYVQPSRGEGFGLQPLQAIALGRPTILSDSHGHAAFAHLGIPISCGESKADYFIYGDAGQWWEPDIEEVCEAMWDVYNNYDQAKAIARGGSELATKLFTWEKTAERFMELLGDQMEIPYKGDGSRVQPVPKLYKIITNQDYDGEVAGRSLRFEKGKEYWDMADIKRIFFDAGILDPRCIEDLDEGLAPEQADQIAEYKAHEAFCDSCGQMLNSGISKSDVLYNEMVAAAQSEGRE